MIVCAACGAQNRDDVRFCGECGAFLEWEGSPATPVSTSTAVAANGAAANGVTTGGAAASGATTNGTTANGVTTSPVAAGAGPASATPTVVVGEEASTAAPSGDPAPVSPAPVIPAAVQPGDAPRRRTATPPPPDVRRPPLPGELACPSCGSGNERSRRFCRSCGVPLAQAEVVRLPWWRRLVRWLFGRRSYTAGERRRPRVPAAARWLRVVIALVCLVAVAAVARPLIVRAVNGVKDQTGAHVPIRPDSFSASSSQREAPPADVSDGATNQYWAPQGPAAGSWLEVSFVKPVRLLDIVVTPGVGTEQGEFLKHARPHDLDVVATAKDGKTTTKALALRDEPGPERFDFEAHDVVRVRFIVKSTYGPGGTPSVAIGELEFFGRN